MRLPNKLVTDSPVATTVNQIIDYIRSLTPRNSATSGVMHTPNGTFQLPAPQVASKAAPAATAQPWQRGVWSATPSSPYMTNDMVFLGSGTSSGTYMSLIDGNTNSPDTGIGWWQVCGASVYL